MFPQPLPYPLAIPQFYEPLNTPRTKRVPCKGKTQASGQAVSLQGWQLMVTGLEENVTHVRTKRTRTS